MKYIHLIDINISINLDNVSFIEKVGDCARFHFIGGDNLLAKVSYADIFAEIEQVSEREASNESA
jgi:hypothetical protein